MSKKTRTIKCSIKSSAISYSQQPSAFEVTAAYDGLTSKYDASGVDSVAVPEDWRHRALVAIKSLRSLPFTDAFNRPVGRSTFSLFSKERYHDVITDPMDFNTVEEGLRTSRYDSYWRLVTDIQKIFRNCRLFNYPGSSLLDDADKCETAWLHLFWAQMLPVWEAGTPTLPAESSNQRTDSAGVSNTTPSAQARDGQRRDGQRRRLQEAGATSTMLSQAHGTDSVDCELGDEQLGASCEPAITARRPNKIRLKLRVSRGSGPPAGPSPDGEAGGPSQRPAHVDSCPMAQPCDAQRAVGMAATPHPWGPSFEAEPLCETRLRPAEGTSPDELGQGTLAEALSQRCCNNSHMHTDASHASIKPAEADTGECAALCGASEAFSCHVGGSAAPAEVEALLPRSTVMSAACFHLPQLSSSSPHVEHVNGHMLQDPASLADAQKRAAFVPLCAL